ncbi:MAG: hypothetical protein Kow00128_01680 [Deltaproteobacteria bacterium]
MGRRLLGRLLPAAVLLSFLSAAATASDRSNPGPGTIPPQIPAEQDSGPTGSSRGALCPDIAFTDLFRKKDLAYVHTPEFAEALSAVAAGTSSFSPPEIPAHWPAAASAWRRHLLAHEWARHRGDTAASPAGSTPGPSCDLSPPWEEFPDAQETCSPFLLYLASREYRTRPGHEQAKIVFPYLVPEAVEDLAERIRPFAFRAADLSLRLAKARELDAEKCAPGKLSLAYATLEEARNRVWADHYDSGRIDPIFARTALAVDDLLTERRYAQRHGFLCDSR